MMNTVMMTMLPSNEVPPAVSKRISLNVNCKLQTSHISCIILCINVSSIIILYASSCYASSYCVHRHILWNSTRILNIFYSVLCKINIILMNLVAPEILVPQQLLGLPFGESVMAECLVEVKKIFFVKIKLNLKLNWRPSKGEDKTQFAIQNFSFLIQKITLPIDIEFAIFFWNKARGVKCSRKNFRKFIHSMETSSCWFRKQDQWQILHPNTFSQASPKYFFHRPTQILFHRLRPNTFFTGLPKYYQLLDETSEGDASQRVSNLILNFRTWQINACSKENAIDHPLRTIIFKSPPCHIFLGFLDATASPSTYPSKWLRQWVSG